MRLREITEFELGQIHAASRDFMQQRLPQMGAGFVDKGYLGETLAAQFVAESCGQFQSAGPSADDNNAVWLTRLVSMARPLPGTCGDAGVGIALASEHGVNQILKSDHFILLECGGRRIEERTGAKAHAVTAGFSSIASRPNSWASRSTHPLFTNFHNWERRVNDSLT
jgi:hypothetical protein